MSLYFVTKKGWRYDFRLNGSRHTKSGFKTKKEAQQAEAKRKEEVLNPKAEIAAEATPTDMGFLELVNKRLDYLKAYCSERHYKDHIYYAKRWCGVWQDTNCSDISIDMLESYLGKRKKQVSAVTANKELRLLKSLFNFGMKPPRNLIQNNPTLGIKFFPQEKTEKYVPSKEDVLKVIMAADESTQNYLWTLVYTMGRMSEINRLEWKDINLSEKHLVLYTRKKKGGHLTPRRIPLNQKLFQILSKMHKNRDKNKPWVFWHRYWSRKAGEWVEGIFTDRKKIMTTLCAKAGVKYFRYHALRHFSASMLDHDNVPTGTVQRILGHESRLTTEIYLHSIGDGERLAVECLDKVF